MYGRYTYQATAMPYQAPVALDVCVSTVCATPSHEPELPYVESATLSVLQHRPVCGFGGPPPASPPTRLKSHGRDGGAS